MSFADYLLDHDPAGTWGNLATADASDDGMFAVYFNGRHLGTVQGSWRAEAMRLDEADASGRPVNDFHVVPVAGQVAA